VKQASVLDCFAFDPFSFQQSRRWFLKRLFNQFDSTFNLIDAHGANQLLHRRIGRWVVGRI